MSYGKLEESFLEIILMAYHHRMFWIGDNLGLNDEEILSLIYSNINSMEER